MGALYYNGSKLKKVYYNNNQVKKLYYNNNLVFSGSGEISYYGTTSVLSQIRYYLAATTVGDYALFGGGQDYNADNYDEYYSTADAYNSSLTRSTPTMLYAPRSKLAATTVGDYALFGGGQDYNNGATTFVDAYDTSLTRSTPTKELYYFGRYDLAATTVGNYALFAGGYGEGYSSVVDAYNTSLTRSTPTELSKARRSLAAASVGDYALFAGGSCNGSIGIVDAYNTSLTRSTPTGFIERYNSAATSIGDYALFVGGMSVYEFDSIYYDSSLTRHSLGPLKNSNGRSYKNESLVSATTGNYAIFAGGSGPTEVFTIS